MVGNVTLMLIVLFLCALAGAFHAYKQTIKGAGSRAGWIYFVTAVGQPNAPIKVGMTARDPAEERMTELRTMSPFPLRVLYKIKVADRFAAEKSIHEVLAPHRLHGEWFDRDATLAYIEHLKGAY